MSEGRVPYLDSDLLVELFGYKNKNSMYVAVHRNSFPVTTYHVAGRLVADREVVKTYFRNLQTEGVRELEERVEAATVAKEIRDANAKEQLHGTIRQLIDERLSDLNVNVTDEFLT